MEKVHHQDLIDTCYYLTEMAKEIKEIYSRCLKKHISIDNAVSEIKALLEEREDTKIPNSTDILSLFPYGQMFIHINKSYYALSSHYEFQVNLVVTFTPSPSGNKVSVLVIPNIVVNDCHDESLYKQMFDQSAMQYTALPILRGRDASEDCLHKEHNVQWDITRQEGYIELRIHPGDKIKFYSQDYLDYTITSCNDRWEIPFNPSHDLSLIAGNGMEITLNKSGDYYFTSRPHKKHLRLYVHVKNCPYHS